MQSEQEVPTARIARRVLVVVAGEVGTQLVERLAGSGFEVRAEADPLRVPTVLTEWRADLVVLGELLPGRAGRQVALSIRSFGALFGVPIVGVLRDETPVNILSWLRVGAVDLWPGVARLGLTDRARALIVECDRTKVQLAPLRVRLLAWARRSQLNGTVTTSPGTPFEGRATFVDGELHAATFSGLEGERALERLCDFDGAHISWDEGTEPVPSPQPDGYRPRVVVIEDDATLRLLLQKQLEWAHYLVDTAADGQAGLQRALTTRCDFAVVDLDIPVVDGWGVLRTMRADRSLREVGVLLLSAQEQVVDTLRVARAGARAYLKKSGRAKELLDTMALLSAPRVRAWNSLTARRATKIEVRALGALWLLRTLAELDCQGRLELEDALGRYELSLSQGQLVEVAAQVGSLRLVGLPALEMLVASRGEGRFVFEQQTPPEGARWLFEVLDELCEVARDAEQRKLHEATQRPGLLVLNPELAALFARVATVPELKVLDAVKHAPADLATLAAHAQLATEDAEVALAELVRRGVLSPAS
ncbi:MAG: response regulator [Myxococcota bacterium]